MDKSLINEKDRFSARYKVGVIQFMQKERSFIDSHARIRCPCKKCKNVILETVHHMKNQLFIYGFNASYTR